MSKWVFPSNNHGQINGIADSGVETFKGTPIKSLAREICQNSLDAHLENGQPTRVCFETFQIPADQIPDIEGLNNAFSKSLDFWSLQSSDKAKKFFKNALKVSAQPLITCLRISDFNTTGLSGSRAEYNTPWCNLTKSTGASDKDGSRGGSFGIGKFAPYACSDFRTVFYSTSVTVEEEAYQGVARLTSFKENGDITQGVGYFGGSKNSPIYKQISLDPSFVRASGESGTDIFILAFNGDKHWKDDLIASVLDGFLYAVYRGDLIVDIEGIEVSKSELPKLMEQYTGQFAENADKYYTVLMADKEKAPTFEADILDMGKVVLRMMIQSDMHKRCAMVRKTGMKIMDRGYISAIIPFAAVLYIEGEKLNNYLRSLENPQHTKWEIDRADNKSMARAVDKAIMTFIKGCLDELKKNDAEESIDPSLGEFLAFDEQEGEQKPEDPKEDISDRIKSIEVKRVTRQASTSHLEQDGDGNHEVDDDNGDITVPGLPGSGSGYTHGGGVGGGEGGGSGDTPGDDSGNNPVEKKKKLLKIFWISM